LSLWQIHSLAELYEKGEWVSSDPVAAGHWFRQAADQEHPEAQYRLGRLYDQGIGVHQDFVLGYLWYNLAAARGVTVAKAARDKLSIKMTPAQIAEGQKLSRQWQPKPVSK
jgi:TPR repeat protein